ncbi:superoxide dismutase [archaeon]|nr:superoxide dismutase [archaeon]
MTHELKPLGYEYDVLEPYIDKETMEIHYSKHHQGYVNKLNTALEKNPELQEKPVEELLSNLNSIPEIIKTAVINNGGGVYNHNFFWQILKKDVEPTGEILNEINKKFGSFEEFKKIFSEAAATVFGSGWTWLVYNKEKKEIEVFHSKNQDSPISFNLTPLIGIDVWEHAYYLKYQNKRPEYIENFFKVINWNKVNELFSEAIK